MKTKILLADDNEDFLSELKEKLGKNDTFEVVGTATDGAQALALFAQLKPQILVLDLVMPGIDGFEVMERLEKGDAKILVASALNQDAFITRATSLGADYYMVKPIAGDALIKRLEGLLSPAPAASPASKARQIHNRSLEEKITNIFITVGIPAHIKGYQFLREAIKMAIDNPDIINSITKKLYPEVAEKFDTSPSKVERAIRHAIEVAWNRGKIENINSLFGVRVYNHNEKPTNGEFIALVADKMLLESV